MTLHWLDRWPRPVYFILGPGNAFAIGGLSTLAVCVPCMVSVEEAETHIELWQRRPWTWGKGWPGVFVVISETTSSMAIAQNLFSGPGRPK